jgi:S-methylmethionine-dependent homocysteine/selenocysteine methylase
METIPSMKEAEALVELLREFPDSKAWLAFSCKVNLTMELRLFLNLSFLNSSPSSLLVF